MPNLLQRGATWLGARLKTAGGRSVVYRRGNRTSNSFTATPQIHDETVVNEDGIGTTVSVYSWTVTTSDLLFSSGEPITPQNGDVIEETLNGEAIQWKVLPFDEKKKCYEWLDSSKLLLTIHTKRVE